MPEEPASELDNLSRYASQTKPRTSSQHPCGPGGKPCLLCTYASEEVQRGERVVEQVGGWVAVVPFWATWPFEILRLSRLGILASLWLKA